MNDFILDVKEAFQKQKGLVLGLVGQAIDPKTGKWVTGAGHFVTPYRLVEFSDHYELYLYDNNVPRIENKVYIYHLEDRWFYVDNQTLRFASQYSSYGSGLLLYPIELLLQKGVAPWVTTGMQSEDHNTITHMLLNNFPNPFNAQTTIRYDIPERSDVTMSIYDVLGRNVRTLVNGQVEPGSYTETWDGKNELGEEAPTGMYIVSMHAKGESIEETKTMKMVLLR